MSLSISVSVLCLCFLVCCVGRVSGQTVSELLSQPGWLVEATPAQVCSTSDCCCFTNVNIFTAGTELYINGTVIGNSCDSDVKRDNLDPPNNFVFSQEFFGMSGVNFTLANATYQRFVGWSLTVMSPTRPTCGFTLWRQSSIPLPEKPTPNPIQPQNITDYAQSYLGDWNFDSSPCAINDGACCCFTGSSTIIRDPFGASSFFISGSPSTGCQTSVNPYQDDFPWPSSGLTSLSTTSVIGFLAKQDHYQITYYTERNTQILLFVDTTVPKCSMRASRSTGGGGGSSGLSAGGIVGILIAVLLVVGAAAFFARRYCFQQRYGSEPSPASPLITH